MTAIKGSPIVFDKLKPDVAAKVLKAVADDMERAKRESEERKKRKKKTG